MKPAAANPGGVEVKNAAAGLYIGLMSGTSLDGVDAVLAQFTPGSPLPRLLASHYLAYTEELKARLLALNTSGTDELHRAACLGNELAELYGQAVLRLLDNAGVGANQILALGNHGQTVRHRPAAGYTLQLGNHARLAELTGITVVGDFRSRDIAAGGQGAPLAPAFHALLAHPQKRRVLVNVGGIANLTRLHPGLPVMGFDSGPGNLLMDAHIQRQRGLPYDANGVWAAQGRVLPALLRRLLAAPFFGMPPPKSAGREEFNLDWVEHQLSTEMAAADVQATLLELTAASLADAIARHCPGSDEIYVCGGGVHNDTLLARLAVLLHPARVASSAVLGVDPDWMEALAFAWLARQTRLGLPGNLPAVTGARGARILGAIYPA